MPLYTYQCPECRGLWDVFKPLRDIERTERCPMCHTEEAGTRRVSAPRILTDYAGYDCPITGKWVEGRAAHRENLARHGCRILEPGEKEEGLARRQALDAALESAVSHTVAEEIHSMPAVKRDQLAAELEHGFEPTITRG